MFVFWAARRDRASRAEKDTTRELEQEWGEDRMENAVRVCSVASVL